MNTHKTIRSFLTIFFVLVVLLTVSCAPAKYYLATSANPASGGTVTPASQIYDGGASVTVTAEPASGYRFSGWSGDAAGSDNTITIVVSNNKSVTANFVAQFTLNVSINTEDGGTVTPSSGTYDEGTQVEFTANAAPGYRFDKWSGDAAGTSEHMTLAIIENTNITANFVRQYVLTTSVYPEGEGTVSPAGGTYDAGAKVTITASPALGNAFGYWSGDASGSSYSTTITMNGDKNIVANFTLMTVIIDGSIGFTLNSIERTTEWPTNVGGSGPDARVGWEYCVISVKIAFIQAGHYWFTTSPKSVLNGEHGASYQDKGWVWTGFILNDTHDIKNDTGEFAPGAIGTLVFEVPIGTVIKTLDLVYLYFDSWSASWERIGQVTRHIIIELE